VEAASVSVSFLVLRHQYVDLAYALVALQQLDSTEKVPVKSQQAMNQVCNNFVLVVLPAMFVLVVVV
jgi:hypothetical protein